MLLTIGISVVLSIIISVWFMRHTIHDSVFKYYSGRIERIELSYDLRTQISETVDKQVKLLVDGEVLDKVKKMESYINKTQADTLNKISDVKFQEKLESLCQDISDKYTSETFEDNMRKVFSKKLGEDMSARLLKVDTNHDSPEQFDSYGERIVRF